MSQDNKNLIPLSERSKDEQREIAQKGGIASGRERRRKRSMQEAARLILSLPVNSKQNALLAKYGIEEKDRTNNILIMAKAVQMAANGNLKAAEFVRDTLGENPKFRIYEKRLELLIKDKEATNALVDDWVRAALEAEGK